jgi:predicted HAD superfamily phosphohydrolase
MMPSEKARIVEATARFIPHYAAHMREALGHNTPVWCSSPSRASAEVVREQIAAHLGVPVDAIIVTPIDERSSSVNMKLIKG